MAKEIGNLRTRLSFDKTGESNLTDLKRDLKGVRSEMNVFRSGSREYRTSLKGMRQESDILTRRLKVQEEQVSELRRRYEESRDATGENSAKTKDLAAQYNNAQAQMNRTKQQLERLNQEIKVQESRWTKLGERMETAGMKMQTVGRATARIGRRMTTRVTVPILGAAAAALKVGADFEEGMSKVQAISGASGEDLQKLSDQAREMGATTRFSATEAASGMEFLAMAGFETNEIMGAMPGLLDLAASSNMDLGRAADIASNIISGFNLQAEETGRVSDVLAKGASTANTNVEQLGKAMEVVAPIGEMVGLEIEGLTAGIGRMSDAGIQGEKAGRMLRQGILRLSDPTGKAADLIEELGINVFDSEGNMKNLDAVVGELNKGLKDMSADAQAAALSTIFGSESTAGWSALLTVGQEDLKDYTKELQNSEGAAKKMADTMEDNAKGAWREFKSAAEEAGIALSEHLLPAVTDAIEYGTDLVRKFGELDDSTQKNIIKMGAFAAAIGPTALVMGNLTTGVGGLLRVGGSVSKMLGRASGAGLIGRLGLMGGPGGVAVLAAAGVGTLAYKLYDAHKEANELHEVTTEVADSMLDEAEALKPLVERFDELKLQSGLTTEEFGRLLDIQQELNETQDPSKVAELKEEYAELAKNSGLNNEELEEMFGLNSEIIEQSPQVEASFTEKGNRVLENTSAVKEYINSLEEMAWIELQIEREKALENEAELRKENKQINEEIKQTEEEIQELMELRKVPMEDIDSRLAEIQEKMDLGLLTQEEYAELEREQGLLLAIKNDQYTESLDALKEQRNELMKRKDLNDEELAKLEQVNQRMAEILLSEVDINWEKGKGLDKLDEEIQKLKDNRKEIIENTSQENKKTVEYQEQLDKLNEAINKHESIRDKIKEEIGYESESNEKKNKGLSILENQGVRLLEIGGKQDNNNKKIDDGIVKAGLLTDELGKDTDKNVNTKVSPTAAKINEMLSAPVTKKIKVTQDIIGSATSKMKGWFYASGTDHHPGGPFIAGEEGWELGRMGNQWEILNAGIYDRPSGYQVFTHDDSKRMLKAMNNIPGYASGTGTSAESNRIIGALNQAQQVIEREVAPEYVSVVVNIDGREAAKALAEPIKNVHDEWDIRKARARG